MTITSKLVLVVTMLFCRNSIGALPVNCGSIPTGSFEIVDMPAAVSLASSNDKLYFYEKPKQCPKSGSCPWKRKTYIIETEYVQEHAISGDFSCVTYTSTHGTGQFSGKKVTGWVLSSGLCSPPLPRKSRADAIEYPKTHKRCAIEYVTRTIGPDEVFYSGKFSNSSGSVVTKYTGGGEIQFGIDLNFSECKLKVENKAYLERDSVAFFRPRADANVATCGITFTFADSYLELALYDCPNQACDTDKIVIPMKH